MIRGGMNLVWTARAPFLQAVSDWMFCNGADEACSGAAMADPVGST